MKRVITISFILLLVLSVFTAADAIVSITPQTPNQFDNLSCLVGGRIREGFSYEWIIGDNVFNQNPLALNGRFAGEEAICNVYVETPFGSRIVGSANVMIEVNAAPVINPPLPDIRIPQGGSDSSIVLDNNVADRHTLDNQLRWSVSGNREINVQIQTNQGNRVVFTPNAGFVGNEVITFTVDDGDGLRTRDTIQVTVFRPNEAPTADITQPLEGLTFWVGEEVIFEAEASDDVAVTRLRWDFGDGEQLNENLAGLAFVQREARHTFDAPGQYRVVFSAGDGEGAHDEDTVTVNVVEMADLDVDITRPLNNEVFFTNEDVQFEFRINGRAVEIESVEWRFGDNARSNELRPVHAYNIPGNYIAEVTVRDTHGGEGSDQVNVVVVQEEPINQAPRINRVNTQAVACIAENVQFSTEAEDLENGVLNYLWDFGDGQFSNVQNPAHAYAVAGRYRLSAAVRDNEGLQDVVVFNITINDCGQIPPIQVPPVADIGADVIGVCVNQLVDFDGSRSNDADGQIVAYTWDFGDESPLALGAQVRHIFIEEGQFDVMLVVIDDDGNIDTAEATIFAMDCGIGPLGGLDRVDKPTLTGNGLAHRFDVMGAKSPAQKVKFMPGETVTLLINMNNFGILDENLELEISVPGLGIYKKERGFTNLAYSATDRAVTFRVPADSSQGWYTARIYIYNQRGDSMVRFWQFYVN